MKTSNDTHTHTLTYIVQNVPGARRNTLSEAKERRQLVKDVERPESAVVSAFYGGIKLLLNDARKVLLSTPPGDPFSFLPACALFISPSASSMRSPFRFIAISTYDQRQGRGGARYRARIVPRESCPVRVSPLSFRCFFSSPSSFVRARSVCKESKARNRKGNREGEGGKQEECLF